MRGNAKTFCIIYKNRVIGFLSKSFHEKLQEYMNKGFSIYEIFVEFVVVWHDKEKGKNNKHPLCKLILKQV